MKKICKDQNCYDLIIQMMHVKPSKVLVKNVSIHISKYQVDDYIYIYIYIFYIFTLISVSRQWGLEA